MSPIVSGGGAQTLLTATVTLTNAQIKTLRTPIAVATPTAGHVAVPRGGMAFVLDDTHGVYVDADGAGGGVSVGYMPDPTTGLNTTLLYIDDAQMGSPGAGVYPCSLNVVGWAWGLPENGGVAPSGAIGIAKLGAAEYTGGGAGNTLKIVTYYIEYPLT